MLCDFRNVRSQIPKGVSGKSAGMCGKHRCWDHRCFHTHGRDQRKRNSGGAFSKAGDVLNGDDAFHHDADSSVSGAPLDKTCCLIAEKLSALMTCSIRHASSAAVSGDTPREISQLEISVCRS